MTDSPKGKPMPLTPNDYRKGFENWALLYDIAPEALALSTHGREDRFMYANAGVDATFDGWVGAMETMAMPRTTFRRKCLNKLIRSLDATGRAVNWFSGMEKKP